MRSHLNLSVLIVAAGCLLLVGVLGMVIVASPQVTAFDTRMLVAVNGVHALVLDAIALAVNVGLGPVGAAIVTMAAMVIVGCVKQSWRTALRLGVVIVVPWATASLVKAVVGRPRPDRALLTHATGVAPSSFSYPSGHTAIAAVLGTVLVLFVVQHARAGATIAAAGVVLITGWSRVYLGVHYPTDVLASIVLATPLTVACFVLTAGTRLFDPEHVSTARGRGRPTLPGSSGEP